MELGTVHPEMDAAHPEAVGAHCRGKRKQRARGCCVAGRGQRLEFFNDRLKCKQFAGRIGGQPVRRCGQGLGARKVRCKKRRHFAAMGFRLH